MDIKTYLYKELFLHISSKRQFLLLRIHIEIKWEIG
jgi:hypothetical protein